eukprot:2941831-Alexandrium_andersonii.AAC.1
MAMPRKQLSRSSTATPLGVDLACLNSATRNTWPGSAWLQLAWQGKAWHCSAWLCASWLRPGWQGAPLRAPSGST